MIELYIKMRSMKQLVLILVMVFVRCFLSSANAALSEDELRSFFKTNTVPFGPEYIERLGKLQIQDANDLCLYLNQPELTYQVLATIGELRRQGHSLNKKTVDAIKQIALTTKEKQRIEPGALNLVLYEVTESEALEFSLAVTSKLGARGLVLLMEWVSALWETKHLGENAQAEQLVLKIFDAWKLIYESVNYIPLEPGMRKVLDSQPFSLAKYKPKSQVLAIKLLEGIDKIASGSHFFLTDYLLNSETNSASVEKQMLGLISKGPIQRAKVILWTLSERHSNNEMAQRILSQAAVMRPELSGYLDQLKNGNIGVNEGMQQPLAELSKILYRKKSLEAE